MPATTERKPLSLGPIAADHVYPLPVFRQLAGLSLWAMRAARRSGLKVHRVGKRAYVRGIDWSEYLENRGPH